MAEPRKDRLPKGGVPKGGRLGPNANAAQKSFTKTAFQDAAKGLDAKKAPKSTAKRSPYDVPTKSASRKREIRARQKTNRLLGAGSRFAGGAAG